MQYLVTEPLTNFEFWGGAAENAGMLTLEEIDKIEDYLSESEETMTKTEVNDFFWFAIDEIASILGYPSWESMTE